MLLFRSEEHIERWCEMQHKTRGGILTLDQTWQLAQAWYGEDRRNPIWRRKTLAEAQSVFNKIGMVGGFWSLSD